MAAQLAAGVDRPLSQHTAEEMEAEWVDHQLPHNKFEKAVGSFAVAGVPIERVMLIPFTLANMETARDDDEVAGMIKKCTCLWMPVRVYVCICVCAYVYVYMYLCVRVCMRVYV